MADKFNFAEVKRKIELTKKQLPVILAKETEKEFVENFKRQGFFGDKWADVNRRDPDKDEYKYPSKRGLSRRTKPILTMTGRLRRAVGMSVRTQTFELIKMVVDIPYANAHNDGVDDTQSVKSHTRTLKIDEFEIMGTGIFSVKTKKERTKRVQLVEDIVVEGYSRKMTIKKRQFMGDHPELTKKQKAIITKFFDKVWA